MRYSSGHIYRMQLSECLKSINTADHVVTEKMLNGQYAVMVKVLSHLLNVEMI